MINNQQLCAIYTVEIKYFISIYLNYLNGISITLHFDNLNKFSALAKYFCLAEKLNFTL